MSGVLPAAVTDSSSSTINFEMERDHRVSKENYAERHFRAVCESEGFTVTRLLERESLGRTADFLIEFAPSRYLVEVKEKQAGLEFQEFVDEAAEKGIATAGRIIERRNGLSKIVRDAATQLCETPEPADFRIVWISCLHEDSSFQFEQLERTIYGMVTLTTHASNGTVLGTKPCFYYQFNEMFGMPSIDAVILSGENGGRLCVNNFSPKLQEFRRSKLYKMFGTAVWDPLKLEASERALVIDGDVDRRDSKALWRFIKDKYGVLTAKMIESQFSGLISVKIDEN